MAIPSSRISFLAHLVCAFLLFLFHLFSLLYTYFALSSSSDSPESSETVMDIGVGPWSSLPSLSVSLISLNLLANFHFFYISFTFRFFTRPSSCYPDLTQFLAVRSRAATFRPLHRHTQPQSFRLEGEERARDKDCKLQIVFIDAQFVLRGDYYTKPNID